MWSKTEKALMVAFVLASLVMLTGFGISAYLTITGKAHL